MVVDATGGGGLVADAAGGGEAGGGGRCGHGHPEMPPADKSRRPGAHRGASAKNQGEEFANSQDQLSQEKAGPRDGPGGGAVGGADWKEASLRWDGGKREQGWVKERLPVLAGPGSRLLWA
ncbi:hypothetical protein OsJ_13221 [Oryza sativa Japonica Group]|uniref:Uncharacterized protein n=1 Tax=Oryza sativa subsp. japonica TaxID=39947 RepID=A3APC3_ORYSJ|nr:hypothetical protein OsJ_13221 [Oryza sativa Japonica Group]